MPFNPPGFGQDDSGLPPLVPHYAPAPGRERLISAVPRQSPTNPDTDTGWLGTPPYTLPPAPPESGRGGGTYRGPGDTIPPKPGTNPTTPKPEPDWERPTARSRRIVRARLKKRSGMPGHRDAGWAAGPVTGDF